RASLPAALPRPADANAQAVDVGSGSLPHCRSLGVAKLDADLLEDAAGLLVHEFDRLVGNDLVDRDAPFQRRQRDNGRPGAFRDSRAPSACPPRLPGSHGLAQLLDVHHGSASFVRATDRPARDRCSTCSTGRPYRGGRSGNQSARTRGVGKVIVTSVPSSGSLLMPNVARFASTSALVSGSPRPVPGLYCRSGRSTRLHGTMAGASPSPVIPIPVSLTRTCTSPESSMNADTTIWPPASVNFTAFDRMLRKIWRRLR